MKTIPLPTSEATVMIDQQTQLERKTAFSITRPGRINLQPHEKERILKRDNWLCQYYGNPAKSIDHIMPQAFCPDNTEENLVSSCALCNALANAKCFNSFEAKRAYILKKRGRRLSLLLKKIWIQSDVEKLGRSLRKRVQSGCIIATDRSEAREIELEILATIDSINRS